MARLYFTCPNTHLRVATGIETDTQSLRAAWSKRIKINCAYCGELHELAVCEIYINGVLDDAVDGFRGQSSMTR